MRRSAVVLLSLSLLSYSASAQSTAAKEPDKTFLTRRDLGLAAAALGTTALISIFDDDIAIASQTSRFQSQSLHDFSTKVSKVNETTLTAAGILLYGAGRLSGNKMITGVALHGAEAVMLASVASQLIRGPLGRARPYVTHDSDQYLTKFGAGFKAPAGEKSFDYRSFPSIHMSSSMAVATVLTMEVNRRHPSLTKFVAPLALGAGLIPGLSRIQLDQHWASDVFAGAFLGVFTGYKVVSYSYAHPNNWFDRTLLKATVMPGENGGYRVGLSY